MSRTPRGPRVHETHLTDGSDRILAVIITDENGNERIVGVPTPTPSPHDPIIQGLLDAGFSRRDPLSHLTTTSRAPRAHETYVTDGNGLLIGTLFTGEDNTERFVEESWSIVRIS